MSKAHDILGKRLRLSNDYDGLPAGTEFDVRKVDFDPLATITGGNSTRGLHATLDDGTTRHWTEPKDAEGNQLSVTIVGEATDR